MSGLSYAIAGQDGDVTTHSLTHSQCQSGVEAANDDGGWLGGWMDGGEILFLSE